MFIDPKQMPKEMKQELKEKGQKFKKNVNKISQSVFGVNVYSSNKAVDTSESLTAGPKSFTKRKK